MRASRFLTGLLFAGAAASGAAACRDVPVKTELPPTGVLRGSFLYSGPPPCTEQGHIVGAAIILLFDERLLPPPEGLAGRSYRIRAIPADELFAEAGRRLTYNDDGSRWCPPDNTAPIFASATWDLSPVEAGRYQARAFYDRSGTFQPAFRFSNLPTRGDITGGAIDNITEALQGKPVKFTEIIVGVPNSEGNLTIPEKGLLIDNLTVAVALPQRVERPYFHVSAWQPALQPKSEAEVTPTTPAPPFNEETPREIVMPADFHLGTSIATQVQPYLYVLELKAGVPQAEAPVAAASPFFMRVDPTRATLPVATQTPTLPIFWYDLNRDGVIDLAGDHVVGSELAASLGPVVSLQKIDATDPIKRTAQPTPRILSSAITLPSRTFTDLLLFQAESNASTPQFKDAIYAGVRPTAVCVLDPLDANGQTVIVTPFKNTVSGGATIGNVPLTKKDIATLLRRNPDNVKIIYGCLPPAELSINIVNTPDITGLSPGGQAWTIPNESGLCMPGEDAGAGKCGSRALLTSQYTVFRFGKPNDPAFCNQNTYEVEGEPETNGAQVFRTNCLNATEQEAFDAKNLWSNLP